MIRFATGFITLTGVFVCTKKSVVNELVNNSLRHREMTDTRARGFWLHAAPQAQDPKVADWIASTKIRGAKTVSLNFRSWLTADIGGRWSGASKAGP